MARTQENLDFSARLKQALSRLPQKAETPSQLALAFNLVHHEPVTNQAVQKWLSGLSKPSPEKIETLGQMCNVSVQWLRYGIAETLRPSQRNTATEGNPQQPNGVEALLLSRFRLLSQRQQELVAGLVEQLALDREIWTEGT